MGTRNWSQTHRASRRSQATYSHDIFSQSLCFVISKVGFKRTHTSLLPNAGLGPQPMLKKNAASFPDSPPQASLSFWASVSPALGALVLGSQNL